ncbi:MAG TPA: M42 family metallopeptidase [Clostridiaceae bacterium]|nr:M42 family metallopeptidase [Clostridiaceae bacterium]
MLDILKELTDINGVSGDEGDVREYIKKQIEGYVDEARVDRIGNLIAYKKGKTSGFTVMLSAHMDEVGFIVTGFSENGNIKFQPVGGIDERILPGKRVLVGKRKIPGIIGSKPVHLLEKEEREKVVKIKDMYIDIGCDSKDCAEDLVKLGDYAVFFSEFTELGNNTVKAKALDDRAGCAVLIEILRQRFDFDLYACFTVQEEVGLRGAEVAAYSIRPDIAVVIEGTTCSDVPGISRQNFSTELGKGAALAIMDRTSYYDKELVDFIYNTAKKNNIDVQFKQTTTGGNDAGKIQTSRTGVRVAAISVPCRYIHSPVSIMNIKDFESCSKLVAATLKELESSVDMFKKAGNGGEKNV